MSENNVKILVVDDEPQIQKMLQVSLSAHHYQVSTAETGQEGITLAAVKESLVRLGAEEVLTAVFADKANGKQKPIGADFVGLSVPYRFVFGYGMDVDGAWRNLPAIYAMKDDA